MLCWKGTMAVLCSQGAQGCILVQEYSQHGTAYLLCTGVVAWRRNVWAGGCGHTQLRGLRLWLRPIPRHWYQRQQLCTESYGWEAESHRSSKAVPQLAEPLQSTAQVIGRGSTRQQFYSTLPTEQ